MISLPWIPKLNNYLLRKDPGDVSWEELRDFVRWLKKEKNLSDRTINHCISQLRFFTLYVLPKPWDSTQLPMRRFDSYLPYVPSRKEIFTFIHSCDNLKHKAIFSLLYSTGLRVGEVYALRYEDISRKRRAEVIDSPYFHVVFTLPHRLNPLIYCNQKLLYGLLHRCCAETLLELSADKKYLGAIPGIIQVLHTWNQEIGYHVHIHCIVSGGGLTASHKIRKSSGSFFIPVRVLRDKFKGKYLSALDTLYKSKKLSFPSPCEKRNLPPLNTVLKRPPQEGLKSMPFYTIQHKILMHNAFLTIEHLI